MRTVWQWRSKVIGVGAQIRRGEGGRSDKNFHNWNMERPTFVIWIYLISVDN